MQLNLFYPVEGSCFLERDVEILYRKDLGPVDIADILGVSVDYVIEVVCAMKFPVNRRKGG